MSDRNVPTKKRKFCENDVIEILDVEPSESSQDFIDVEIDEPDSKVTFLDTSQGSDCDLEIVSLNSSSQNEIIDKDRSVDFKQRLLELEDTIKQLKAENEELKSKACSCSILHDAELTISFNNIINFKRYLKDPFIEKFRHKLEYSIKEDETHHNIKIFKDPDINPKEWVIVDNDSGADNLENATKPKKKKKKRTKNKKPELFILDTTPSISTKNSLIYESKFTVKSNTKVETEKVLDETPKSVSKVLCFNCNGNHSLRDCTKPKDSTKINSARQKFKAQTKLVRYHLEEDQRFAHLQPGKLSEELKKALGLKYNQLPLHIYRMRHLGYPPGWFNELLAVQHSNLVLFDFKGKNAFNKKTVQDLDPDKIIEFPGFNVPMEKGFKDEHRLYNCPSFSQEVSKEKMLEFLHQFQEKAKDNLEACDMDIDAATSDKEIDDVICIDQANASPSLNDLESQKQQLLDELVNDDVQIVEEATDLNKTADSSQSNLVKTTCLGTPILKSASPYLCLPHSEKFSRDVSEVINFENLPNTTGKYEQMLGVLDKVRKTMKVLNEPKL